VTLTVPWGFVFLTGKKRRFSEEGKLSGEGTAKNIRRFLPMNINTTEEGGYLS